MKCPYFFGIEFTGSTATNTIVVICCAVIPMAKALTGFPLEVGEWDTSLPRHEVGRMECPVCFILHCVVREPGLDAMQSTHCEVIFLTSILVAKIGVGASLLLARMNVQSACRYGFNLMDVSAQASQKLGILSFCFFVEVFKAIASLDVEDN